MKIDGRISLSDFITKHANIIIPTVMVIGCSIFVATNTYVDYLTEKENKMISKQLEDNKINMLQTSKKPLVCGGDYLAVSDYDVVKLSDKIYIERVKDIGTGKLTTKLSDCIIYDKQTSSIVPPKPLTMEQRVENELNSLKTQNQSLSNQVNTLVTKVEYYTKLSNDKSLEIEKLNTIITSKQKDIDELSSYSIKYKEVKELLKISLAGNSEKMQTAFNTMFDKPVKAQKEFAMKPAEEKIMNTAKKVALQEDLETPISYTTDDIKMSAIKSRILMMRQITKMFTMKSEEIKFEKINDSMITINAEQVKYFDKTKANLDSTINNLIKSLAKKSHMDYDILVKEVFRIIDDATLKS